MITNNFRLNALANQHATAIYHVLVQQNSGDWFIVSTTNGDIRIDITDDFKGIRDLVNSYVLLVLKRYHKDWELRDFSVLDECLESGNLTSRRHEI
ncbi:hypothetical protein L579_1526 [Pantoea sp. AS-PWVM4]|uniref:hypothetical protein n=1 Tax=Pantoea sp. AS-PWVM4 TaxID=1332069 RepID=UPI0003AC7CA0|nr:hypothetical protein [Pantoea sp. AS-PWVM4]ERK18204.1 hypothetical protein L579_1526 [Pantoea sp. AS-PWVM4]